MHAKKNRKTKIQLLYFGPSNLYVVKIWAARVTGFPNENAETSPLLRDSLAKNK